MKYVIIGAGNAGRPAARILNHIGNEVFLTDQKLLEEFPLKVQRTLKIMENEGVKLLLGPDTFLDFENIDSAYISPTIPDNSPLRDCLEDNDVKIVDNKYISTVINDILELDVIGITGTLGKTSTTHILSEIFKQAGFRVWTCSSRMGNLLSEVIVDGIINGLHIKNNIAVLELPHGTSRLMSQVDS